MLGCVDLNVLCKHTLAPHEIEMSQKTLIRPNAVQGRDKHVFKV